MKPTLIIAEKPELARAIAEVVGPGQRKNGYIDCGDHLVTWCYGHMLELVLPPMREWSWDKLPYDFVPWHRVPIEKSRDQLDQVRKLLGSASRVIHAGDPDEEGQLLVDEVLEWAETTLPVDRVLINDTNPKLVRRALDSMRPNAEFSGMSKAAEARQVADAAYGVNMTRGYTLAAQAKGYDGVLSVGRVQTPIMGLVVRRTRENARHTKAWFYQIYANCDIEGKAFKARYQIREGDPVDEKGRLCDAAHARAIATAITGKAASLVSSTTTPKSRPAPLPFNLLKLQMEASRLYGLKPDQVKDITQALREKYKLITYNRSDCQYLSAEQHEDAPDVLRAVARNLPSFEDFAGQANPSIKSRAFDSSKVTAHHAIIPTEATPAMALLTAHERAIYQLIARAYVAQFYPAYTYDQTDLVVDIEGYRFTASAKVPTAPGWTVLFGADLDAEEDGENKEDGEDERLGLDLRPLQSGNQGVCREGIFNQCETKPPALYTMASLLADLTRVAKYIQDERLRRLLIEKDKDKKGEAGGIGTPATRDAIVMGLFKRGFLAEKGKHIVSTMAGEALYDTLPDRARFPDMTALWHEQQTGIAAGKVDQLDFLRDLQAGIAQEIHDLKTHGLAIKVDLPLCPKCKRPLRRINGKNGPFWSCTGREQGCTYTANDKNGKPVPKAAAAPISSQHKCHACGAGLQRKPSTKQKGKFFWSCSRFPECRQAYPDVGGKPLYPAASGSPERTQP